MGHRVARADSHAQRADRDGQRADSDGQNADSDGQLKDGSNAMSTLKETQCTGIVPVVGPH